MFFDALRKIGQRTLFAVEAVGAGLILVMMAHVVVNIAGRTVFSHPLQGTSEILEYWYMPIIAGIGFVVAKAQNEHLEAPIIFEMLGEVNKRLLAGFIYVVAIVSALAIAYYGLLEANYGMSIGKTAGASAVTAWPAQYIVPIVFIVLAAQFVIDFVTLIRQGEAEAEGPDQVVEAVGLE